MSSSFFFAAIAAAIAGTVLLAQERTRETTPDAYKWNLTDLYASDDAWQAAKAALATGLPEAQKFKGTLAQSGQQLASALDLQAAQEKTLARLAVYANLAADQDTRVAEYQGMRQQITQLGAAYGAQWAWLEPELLGMAPGTLEQFIDATAALKPYAFYLHDVLRRKAHTLDAAQEKLIAETGPMASGAGTTANIFLNADLPWPTVKNAEGKEVRLDVAGFSDARQSPSRPVRQEVMEQFFGALGSYRRTLGSTLSTAVQAARFETEARHYDSTLARSLDGPNIPESVYTQLVDGVNRHLPAFQRYLKLRKRMMALDDLHYYDLYAPLVPDVPLEYSVEQAEQHVKEALAPLGPDYLAALDRAFKERWIDYYPTPGKRSGAYMAGSAYDVHPYLLLNYNGRYTDMSTLAHELGHAMHSFFSNKTQPYATAGYPIFVAEVASTFNEALLIEHMLQTITDPKTRLSLLGNYLEGVKGTVFRQTQFAEFELRMHEMAQSGQPITGDALSKLYLDITRKYYGHDAQVCLVDDYVADEWAYITHFYRPFYVFQYATSFTASTALAEKVMKKEPQALEHYRRFLASGGSDYPIELLKEAGVDMRTSSPLDLTIQKMERVMEEMEGLVDKM